VLYLGGRFSITDQLRWPLPLFGFMAFTLHTRYVLTPLSAMTWANLNHTLCTMGNDPWRDYFGMGNYFYFWAEVYLGLCSIVGQYFIGVLAFILCSFRQFSIH
jgi:hypothetical protein